MNECLNCHSRNIEFWGQIECDDEESLELFCEQYHCRNCRNLFIGNLVSDSNDDQDDWADDDYDIDEVMRDADASTNFGEHDPAENSIEDDQPLSHDSPAEDDHDDD